jgi:CheY-like chemotaxis protein
MIGYVASKYDDDCKRLNRIMIPHAESGGNKMEHGYLADKKILIVDDEPDILDVLEELLNMCDISRARNYEDAKKLLESKPFDMAILDIMGVNGYGLLEIAKDKKIPAIMLTAHAFTPDNLVRSIREGAASYIPKDEISKIADFMTDVFKSMEAGINPWGHWEERLPSSFFEKRWGAAWQDTNKDFWETFRASLRSRK